MRLVCALTRAREYGERSLLGGDVEDSMENFRKPGRQVGRCGVREVGSTMRAREQ